MSKRDPIETRTVFGSVAKVLTRSKVDNMVLLCLQPDYDADDCESDSCSDEANDEERVVDSDYEPPADDGDDASCDDEEEENGSSDESDEEEDEDEDEEPGGEDDEESGERDEGGAQSANAEAIQGESLITEMPGGDGSSTRSSAGKRGPARAAAEPAKKKPRSESGRAAVKADDSGPRSAPRNLVVWCCLPAYSPVFVYKLDVTGQVVTKVHVPVMKAMTSDLTKEEFYSRLKEVGAFKNKKEINAAFREWTRRMPNDHVIEKADIELLRSRASQDATDNMFWTELETSAATMYGARRFERAKMMHGRALSRTLEQRPDLLAFCSFALPDLYEALGRRDLEPQQVLPLCEPPLGSRPCAMPDDMAFVMAAGIYGRCNRAIVSEGRTAVTIPCGSDPAVISAARDYLTDVLGCVCFLDDQVRCPWMSTASLTKAAQVERRLSRMLHSLLERNRKRDRGLAARRDESQSTQDARAVLLDLPEDGGLFIVSAHTEDEEVIAAQLRAALSRPHSIAVSAAVRTPRAAAGALPTLTATEGWPARRRSSHAVFVLCAHRAGSASLYRFLRDIPELKTLVLIGDRDAMPPGRAADDFGQPFALLSQRAASLGCSCLGWIGPTSEKRDVLTDFVSGGCGMLSAGIRLISPERQETLLEYATRSARSEPIVVLCSSRSAALRVMYAMSTVDCEGLRPFRPNRIFRPGQLVTVQDGDAAVLGRLVTLRIGTRTFKGDGWEVNLPLTAADQAGGCAAFVTLTPPGAKENVVIKVDHPASRQPMRHAASVACSATDPAVHSFQDVYLIVDGRTNREHVFRAADCVTGCLIIVSDEPELAVAMDRRTFVPSAITHYLNAARKGDHDPSLRASEGSRETGKAPT
jgi:hypothetical protein